MTATSNTSDPVAFTEDARVNVPRLLGFGERSRLERAKGGDAGRCELEEPCAVASSRVGLEEFRVDEFVLQGLIFLMETGKERKNGTGGRGGQAREGGQISSNTAGCTGLPLSGLRRCSTVRNFWWVPRVSGVSGPGVGGVQGHMGPMYTVEGWDRGGVGLAGRLSNQVRGGC